MKKECIAMLLAGGQGSRLYVLTSNVAKPAVPFGGKYRIIDFPLSNCTNAGIDTVGVLTQYKPLELNSYIGSGQPWDLDRSSGGVHILPPYMVEGDKGSWYKGTANAIYQDLLKWPDALSICCTIYENALSSGSGLDEKSAKLIGGFMRMFCFHSTRIKAMMSMTEPR